MDGLVSPETWMSRGDRGRGGAGVRAPGPYSGRTGMQISTVCFALFSSQPSTS